MAQRDIYIAIMVAAAQRRGLHLSADEIGDLAQDDAISTAACNGLDEKDWPRIGSGTNTDPAWVKINPYRKRTPGNFAV